MDSPQIDRHVHWKFTAWNGKSPDEVEQSADKTMSWVVRITVIGYATEADATIAARSILQRDHFALMEAWECQSCGFQNDTAQALASIVKQAG